MFALLLNFISTFWLGMRTFAPRICATTLGQDCRKWDRMQAWAAARGALQRGAAAWISGRITLCERCGTRPATQHAAIPSSMLTHGHGSRVWRHACDACARCGCDACRPTGGAGSKTAVADDHGIAGHLSARCPLAGLRIACMATHVASADAITAPTPLRPFTADGECKCSLLTCKHCGIVAGRACVSGVGRRCAECDEMLCHNGGCRGVRTCGGCLREWCPKCPSGPGDRAHEACDACQDTSAAIPPHYPFADEWGERSDEDDGHMARDDFAQFM